MSTTSLVNNSLNNPATVVSLQKTQRQAVQVKTTGKSSSQPSSGTALVLPEDIVTLSSTSSNDTPKKASQPVTPDEKRALLGPNVSFSVYG